MEKINFQDLPSTATPLNSSNLKQMQDNMENAIIPIKLVSISDTAPASATTGDMYYNTTDNKVYTAIGENTWDSGSTPRYDGFYINTNDNTLFYYNGTSLVGVGGSQTSINVKNEETTSETDVYSCNYINNMHPNIVTDGSPVKTGRKIDGKEEWVKRINFGALPNNSAKDVNTGLNANNITVTEIKGLGVRSSDNLKFLLPYISSAGTNIELSGPVISNNQYVRVVTTTDRTNITAKIEIHFTYNS